MRRLSLYLVDDEPSVLESLNSRLSVTLAKLNPNFNILSFTKMSDAKASLRNSQDLVIIILDHDFGDEPGEFSFGYDLGAWIKTNFWTRHFTPIIYFTGRETEASYNKNKVELGQCAPDFYFPKNKGYSTDLEELIGSLHVRVLNFEDTLDQHGLEVALSQFTGIGWDI